MADRGSAEADAALAASETAARLTANIERVVVGKQDQISLVLAARA